MAGHAIQSFRSLSGLFGPALLDKYEPIAQLETKNNADQLPSLRHLYLHDDTAEGVLNHAYAGFFADLRRSYPQLRQMALHGPYTRSYFRNTAGEDWQGEGQAIFDETRFLTSTPWIPRSLEAGIATQLVFIGGRGITFGINMNPGIDMNPSDSSVPGCSFEIHLCQGLFTLPVIWPFW